MAPISPGQRLAATRPTLGDLARPTLSADLARSTLGGDPANARWRSRPANAWRRPGQRSAISPGQCLAPISPGQALDAWLEANRVVLTTRQSLVAIVSVSRWSMRPWNSVRPVGKRRRGLPRSHGPSAEQLAAQRLTSGQWLGKWQPRTRLPGRWRSIRPRRRSTGQPSGMSRRHAPEALGVSGLAAGPMRSLATSTGSGDTP